jgi:hypothetical protein
MNWTPGRPTSTKRRGSVPPVPRIDRVVLPRLSSGSISVTALRRLGSQRGGSNGCRDGLPRIQRGLREGRAQAEETTDVHENDCQSTLGRKSAAGESAAVGAERQSARASLGDAAGSGTSPTLAAQPSGGRVN